MGNIVNSLGERLVPKIFYIRYNSLWGKSMKKLSRLIVVGAMAASALFAQEQNRERDFEEKALVACEEAKLVVSGLAGIKKAHEKITDKYDKSERQEKDRYERITAEIALVGKEGVKVVNAYSECMKGKLQSAKEFKGQSNLITVKVSVQSTGAITNGGATVKERTVKKGVKTTKVGKPTIKSDKNPWCSDGYTICHNATIVLDQK